MAVEVNQVYKCSICGNIVEVLYARGGELVCCGKPMELQQEKTQEQGMEKHVPIVEKTDKGIKVGSVPHPMEKEHYIQWIEVVADGKVYRKQLQPGQNPEAEFAMQAENIVAREYCNVHGLWKSGMI